MMMTNGMVKERVAAFLKIPVDRLSDDVPLARLIADSFMIIELLVDLQEEFGIHLRQEELKKVLTLADLAWVVRCAHARDRCSMQVLPTPEDEAVA